jgi:hypothetical protein
MHSDIARVPGFDSVCRMGFPKCAFIAWVIGAAWAAGAENPWLPAVQGMKRGELHLRVILLSASAEDAARWMLEHKGEPEALADRLLQESTARGIQKVAEIGVTDKRWLNKSTMRNLKVLTQKGAGQLWEVEQEEIAAGKRQPTHEVEDYLYLDREIGTYLQALVGEVRDEKHVALQIKFTHTAEPEERPTIAWPLARGRRAPRMIFRSWTVEAPCWMTPGKPVMLGMQMEPPHEGGVNTSRVWFAVAQLDGTPIPEPVAVADGAAPLTTKNVETVGWVFSVPGPFAAKWIETRGDASTDAATLKEWLERPHAKVGPSLTALMHVRHRMGANGKMTSVRFWDDGTGFEPGLEGPAYRAKVVDPKDYELRHEWETEVKRADEGARVSVDPWAVTVPTQDGARKEEKNKDEDASAMLRAKFNSSIPPAPARWKRVESAMEKDAATDPWALELAALGAEQCESAETLANGEIIASAVWPYADGMRVMFVRCQDSRNAEPPIASRPPRHARLGTGMVWFIDTEVAPWIPLLTLGNDIDDGSIAQKLLDEIERGTSKIAGMFMRNLTGLAEFGEDRLKGKSQPPEGYLYEYLNTHPHPGGIAFNPRSFMPEGPGWEWDWNPSAGPYDKHAQMTGSFMAPTGPTGTRRWGVRLAQHTHHTPATSGIDLPERGRQSFNVWRAFPWRRPLVVNVVQFEEAGTSKLRWVIGRMDPPRGVTPGPDPKGWKPAELPPGSDNWVQVMLLGTSQAVADDLAKGDKSSGAVEARWLRALAEGKARLMDLAASSGNPINPVSVRSTRETTYVEPRDPFEGLHVGHPTIPREPPKGTVYDPTSGQIGLMPHYRGIEFQWKENALELVHDGDFEVVTDTLLGRYEFPYDAHHKTQPVSVSVQRPVFAPHRGEVPWPLERRSLLVPWTGMAPPSGEKWFFLIRALDSPHGP